MLIWQDWAETNSKAGFFPPMCPVVVQNVLPGHMLLKCWFMQVLGKWAEFGRKNQQFESIITKSSPTPSMTLQSSFKASPTKGSSNSWLEAMLGVQLAVVGPPLVCYWPVIECLYPTTAGIVFVVCPVLLPLVGSYWGLFDQSGPSFPPYKQMSSTDWQHQ